MIVHAPESTPAQLANAGWPAGIELDFELSGGRTVLARRRHFGPLAVQRPFYPEPDGTCHVIVLHPPGGVAGGDTLDITARAGRSANVLLTTPAAQKLYRGFGRRARLEQRFELAAGARLQWLPLETIAFDGVEAESVLQADLAEDAVFIGWEITCLGRPAAGERLVSGRLLQRWELRREGTPLFRERAEYRGAGDELSAAWGLGGHPVVGLMLCAAPGLRAQPDLADSVRAASDDACFAVSQLADGMLCRYRGPSVERAHTAFRSAWNRLRSRLWQAEACTPRIWLT
jgi:urease accessory protein